MTLSFPRTYLPTLPQPKPWTPPGFPLRVDQLGVLDAGGQGKVDTYDLLIQLGSVITAVLHEIYGYPLQTAVYAAQAYIDYKKGADAQHADLAKKKNPLLDAHGMAAGKFSPVTHSYLVARRWKKIGGSAVQAVGNLMSLSPANLHQNVPGAIYHGQAAALTVFHLGVIEKLARTHVLNAELQDWINVIRLAKTTKLAIRGGQLAGAVLPAASLPTSVVAAAFKAGVKMTYAGACLAAAAKLHFAAYCERHPSEWLAAVHAQPLPGTAITADHALKPPAPAPVSDALPAPAQPRNFSRPFRPSVAAPAPAPAVLPYLPTRTDGAVPIMRELFTRRLGPRLLGAYDVDAIIDEPAGWLALGDKLMLI